MVVLLARSAGCRQGPMMLRSSAVLCRRRLSRSTLSPVAYVTKRTLPHWHRIKVFSNVSVAIVPNTTVTQFLTAVGTSGDTQDVCDGDQTMSVWFARPTEPSPTTFQSLSSDLSDYVRFESSPDEMSVKIHIPKSVLDAAKPVVGNNPWIAFHIPLKTSIDLSTHGDALVHDVDCDDVNVVSIEANCEVADVKVANTLAIDALPFSMVAGSVRIPGTVVASQVTVNAGTGITANRLLATDVSLAAGDKGTLRAESIYAKSVDIKARGSFKSSVISATDKCRIHVAEDVNIGALSGGVVSVESWRGEIQCALDKWSQASFFCRKDKCTLIKPYSSDPIELEELPRSAKFTIIEHVPKSSPEPADAE